MNHLFARSFLAVLCGTLLCIGSNFSYANEESPFPEVIPIEEEKNEDLAESSVLLDSINPSSNDSHYLQRIHNDGYYHLVAFSGTGDVIQLHDASKWEIENSGHVKVLYWVQNDDIFIKPSVSWFSSYQYVLYNRTTNQAVHANLIHPPLPMGAYTFRIVNIEPYQRLVLLSDNTVWQVGPGTDFSNWQVGQRLLVGVNNKWRTAPFPHVLINIDLNGKPYSPAIFYGYPA